MRLGRLVALAVTTVAVGLLGMVAVGSVTPSVVMATESACTTGGAGTRRDQ